MTYVSSSHLFWNLSRLHLIFLASSWVLRAISWTLPGFPELCPNSPVLMVGPPGALRLICACSLHATCLSIFLIAGLGLGASCWHTLSVVCLCWAWSIHVRPCVILCSFWLPQWLAAHGTHTCYVLKAFKVTCLGVETFCCLKVMVAGCWLCYFGPCLAVGLPQGFIVAF